MTLTKNHHLVWQGIEAFWLLLLLLLLLLLFFLFFSPATKTDHPEPSEEEVADVEDVVAIHEVDDELRG